MLEIAISRELAAAHPDFMAGCAQPYLRVEVFGDAHERPEARAATDTPDPDRVPDAVYIGQRHPEKGYYADCTGTFGTDPDDSCGCPICQAAAQSVADL